MLFLQTAAVLQTANGISVPGKCSAELTVLEVLGNTVSLAALSLPLSSPPQYTLSSLLASKDENLTPIMSCGYYNLA